MDEILKNNINEVFNIFNQKEEVEKKEIYHYLEEINSYLEESFKDFKYQENFLNPFKYNEDERLSQIEHKIENFSKIPELGLLEGIKYYEQKLSDFLDVYNIGFIHSFKLDSYGSFKVEISSLITKFSSFHDKDISNKIKFDLQMENLAENGILTTYKKNMDKKKDIHIIATEECLKNLKKLLIDFGATLIKFTLQDNDDNDENLVLNKISFRILPSKFTTKNYSMPEVKFSCNDNILNPDEKNSIIHDFKELWNAYLTFQTYEPCQNSCYGIIRSLFANICRTCNFECSIFTQEENKHKTIREKNILIRKKEEELGRKVSGDIIKQTINKLYSLFNKIGYENFYFRCQDILASKYQIEVSFHSTTDCFEKDIIPIKEETLKENFECSNGSFDDESLKILATNNNFKAIENIIKTNIPNATITSFDVKNHWSIGYNYIEGFKIQLDVLNGLF